MSYRSPGLEAPMTMTPEQARTAENYQVLMVTQAMLGLISPNVRAVSVVVEEEKVTIHFVLMEDRPEDREAIDDIVVDFAAFQPKQIAITSVATVTKDQLTVAALPGRAVFLARGDEPDQ